MLNQQHLALLNSGVTNFNNARDENPDLKINLSRAYLSNKDLRWANFNGADLHMANFSGANLSGANLSEANIFCANILSATIDEVTLLLTKWTEAFQADITALLNRRVAGTGEYVLPTEQVGLLLAAIRAGEINGRAYSGKQACLFGTLARIRNMGVTCFCAQIGHTKNLGSPIEQLFGLIRPGDTPDNSRPSRMAILACVHTIKERLA